jgi:hypothetical protein
MTSFAVVPGQANVVLRRGFLFPPSRPNASPRCFFRLGLELKWMEHAPYSSNQKEQPERGDVCCVVIVGR